MKSLSLKKEEKLSPVIYQRLFEVGKHLLAETEIDAMLNNAIDSAIEMASAERGMVILFNEEGDSIFQTARNLERKDIENPAFQKSDSVMRLRILSVICLPLMHDDQIFGVVYLDNRKIRSVFKQEIFTLIQEFTNFISLAAYSAWERNKLHRRVKNLESELRGRYDFSSIIGTHPAMVEILKLVFQVAETNATVLIQGESGTGKELIARAIHFNSNRKDSPFVPIYCGAFPEHLLDSELFGHVRGAFTGACSAMTSIIG